MMNHGLMKLMKKPSENMLKKPISLRLSQESIDILETYAFFHDTTIDDIADSSILMMPFHEGRTKQIQEYLR